MAVSDYQRRFSVRFVYDWANDVTTFLTFLVSVSFGFAITNVAPCKHLDGDFIATTFLEQLGYSTLLLVLFPMYYLERFHLHLEFIITTGKKNTSVPSASFLSHKQM